MAEVLPPAPKVAKLDKDAGGGEDGQREPTEEEQQTLEKVVSIQHEIDQLNEKASEEILHVEQKYNKLRQPHYTRRSELIASIPDFWHNTLINNPQFLELLNTEDSVALQYLTNLTVEEYEEAKSGYKIALHFRDNPYFTNLTLCKEVVMERSGETNVTGTQIQWKEGKNLTEENHDSNSNGRKRALEESSSFFSWFSEESTLEEPGEIIRDDIWPNPLQFYLGGSEPGLNETYDEEEEEEEEGDDDEEEDGLEEEEEEEDEQEVINLSDGDDEQYEDEEEEDDDV